MDILGGSTGYVILKSLHVIAAVTWVGGSLGINVLATRLRKSGDSSTMARFAKEAEWIGMHVFMPASIALLALGIWMVATSAWNFSDLWIELGIAGIIATVITGAAVIGPTSRKLGELIEAHGAENAEVQAAIGRLLQIARVDLVVLLLVVIDMVVKPVV